MENSELQTATQKHDSQGPEKAVVAPEHGNDQSVSPFDRFFGGGPGDASNGGVARLLRSASLEHSANGSVRAIAFKRAQQTHGNRFAQRALAGRFVQRDCSCGGTCEKCRTKEEASATAPAEFTEESTRLVQRQTETPATPVATESNGNDVIPPGSGEPLDEKTRDFTESRFGVDFKDVRVHTDSQAGVSAEALNANAYTSGRDIYFATGKYTPGTKEGQRLLAHELAHTVQQSSNPGQMSVARTQRERSQISSSYARQSSSNSDLVIDPDDSLEQDADRAADQVAESVDSNNRGVFASAVHASGPAHGLQRSEGAGPVMIQRNGAPLPPTAAANDAATTISEAVRNGDIGGVVQQLRGKSVGELQSIRALVSAQENVWLERWLVGRMNRASTVQTAVKVLSAVGAALTPATPLLGTAASIVRSNPSSGNAALNGTAEEGVRRLWPAVPLIDRLELYDEGYRELEQAQLDVIRAASPGERAAARTESKRLDAIYAELSAKEEYDARLLIDPEKKYTAAECLLKRAPGVLSDEADAVFDSIWALTPTERRTFYKTNTVQLYHLLSADRFKLLGTLVAGTEAEALIARLRLATEGRIDDQEAIRAVVDRAVALLAEQKGLRATLAVTTLPPDELSKAQARLDELGELDSLVRFGAGKLESKSFLGRLADAADSPDAFGAMAQKLGSTITDPAQQTEFAFRTAKQRVLMAAGLAGANEDSIRNSILELRAPPLTDAIKLTPAERDQKQAEANSKLRQRLLDDKEVKDVINTMPASAGVRVRSFVNADPFIERLTELTLAFNAASWGEFFQIVLQIAMRDDWKARFEDTSKSPFDTFARVQGEQRVIMLDILQNKRIPTNKILGITFINVEALRTALANMDEGERGQLRVGYLLTRSGRKPADKTEEDALAAYTSFDANLRKSQTTLGLVDTAGVEAVLDAALGAEPTAKEMETDAGRYDAAALMYERQQARLALGGGLSASFTETDETMVAAGREFAALWLQLRERTPHKLSTVELGLLSVLHDRFNSRAAEFTEASNTAGEVAGMVAATVAGIIIVVGTGGVTAPAVIAAAAAGGTARVVTREMFGEDYYNPAGGEGARDALLGGVDAALAVLGASLGAKGAELLGLGGKAFLTNAARVGGEAAEQASGKLLHRVTAGAVEAAIDGALSGFVSEAANAMTDARTWRRGIWQGLLRVGQAALIGGLSGLAAGAVLGAAIPVLGAGFRSAADRLLGSSVERTLAKAGATETLEAARSAMLAGNTEEAERLFAELEKHLSAEQANLLWRDLARLTEGATRLEEPITLLGQRHTLKLVEGEKGAFFMLCSWCTRLKTILEASLDKVAKGSDAAKRLGQMIDQLDQMEANITQGAISKKKTKNVETMKSLLGMLTEGEHLIGKTLGDIPARTTQNFSKLASDPAVARRAAELYEGYLEQLWASRRALFRGDEFRRDLAKALEEEAQARALSQAQRESPRGAPLELPPGAPARTTIDPKVDVPFGFYDRAAFDAFSKRLNAALEIRASNSKLVMEGSGVTGRRFERLIDKEATGSPFGLGRMSDYDVAIISDALFQEAQRLRIPMQGGAVTETKPLLTGDIARLNLTDLDTVAQAGIRDATGIAHPVHFKIRPSGAPDAAVNLPLAPGDT
jgi:hypothetical protein